MSRAELFVLPEGITGGRVGMEWAETSSPLCPTTAETEDIFPLPVPRQGSRAERT
ncbi:hypothetical protein MASR2M17_02090 [Aminivibrio sp.]